VIGEEQTKTMGRPARNAIDSTSTLTSYDTNDAYYTTTPSSNKLGLQRLLDLDVALSKYIFQWSLPLSLEFFLSIPGNLFGPPLLQIVGPFWIVALASSLLEDNDKGDADADGYLGLWMATWGSTFGLLLVPWTLFLQGQTWIYIRFLFSHASFVFSPLIGMSISQHYCLQEKLSTIAPLCFHFIMLWNASCVPVLLLKHGTRRLRPCCTYPVYLSKRHFPIIPNMLSKTGAKTSFPSGDVMSATCFALTLFHLPIQHNNSNHSQYLLTLACISIVFFSALERMYFLAHHLLDTLVGMAIPTIIHMMLVCSAAAAPAPINIFFPTIGTAQWYHSLAAFLGLVVASRYRSSDQK